MLAALSRHDGDAVALTGRDGQKLADALDELAASDAAAGLLVETPDYVELFSAALAGRVVRRRRSPVCSVRILGPLEARLTESDRVVLGGLVEGTWPPESNNDAWLSRPMRLTLGLDLPERRIGLSAHDFAQLLGAREVILSHAAKIAGAPTVPSRFVQRLAAVAGARWEDSRQARRNLSRLGARTRPAREQVAAGAAAGADAAARGAAEKPLGDRDRRLAARSLYDLRQARSAAAAARCGRHRARRRRARHHHSRRRRRISRRISRPAFRPIRLRELIALGEPHFAALEDFPEARAFWWPRFVRIAHWFARWDAARRGAIAALAAEIRGEIEIALADGTFSCAASPTASNATRAGRYVILDYKTGSVRSEKQVRTGFAPQLTLEAAILRRGGFAGIPAGTSVGEIAYVKLKGGEPAGEYEPIKFKEGTPDSQADRALERLTRIAQALRYRHRAVPLARSSDVADPLRRLRPSRAREGMVAKRRRRSTTCGGGE